MAPGPFEAIGVEPATVRLGRVRSSGWTRVSYGLHRHRHEDQLRAWQLVLPPSGAFTGLTAAGRFGWWLPPLDVDAPVFACQSAAEPRPRRNGLVVTRHPGTVPTVELDGLRFTSPAHTLLRCAAGIGLLDLTVLLDSALRCGVSREDLHRVSGQRRRGAPLLRRALQLTDARSESPWESLLRLLHVCAGVEVRPQKVILDRHGDFVARADLHVVGTTVIHEYDGGVHLTREAQRHDLERGRRLVAAGWTRRGYTSVDLLHRAAGVLRDLESSLGRPVTPGAALRWHAALADSLHTPSGRERFRRKVVLPSTTGHGRQPDPVFGRQP